LFIISKCIKPGSNPVFNQFKDLEEEEDNKSEKKFDPETP
jgi:hypothetical protein